ncbi:zf-HC2 domain-containing protein [Nocardia sp. NPDC051832]|uniref:zf-HC2 domain-containing protein n=1 Tax=Nocardia sp. NPDC051832 TaxID=3155673 RepID=UPI0034371072
MSGEARPRFRPTEHLASEAIAAYVDGELRMNAYLRAAQHLAQCPECAAEVDAQQQARVALRQSGPIQIPHRLHDSLSRIPLGELPGAGPASGPAADQPTHSAPGNARGEAVFGFLPDSFTATRWAQWWRK